VNNESIINSFRQESANYLKIGKSSTLSKIINSIVESHADFDASDENRLIKILDMALKHKDKHIKYAVFNFAEYHKTKTGNDSFYNSFVEKDQDSLDEVILFGILKDKLKNYDKELSKKSLEFFTDMLEKVDYATQKATLKCIRKASAQPVFKSAYAKLSKWHKDTDTYKNHISKRKKWMKFYIASLILITIISLFSLEFVLIDIQFDIPDTTIQIDYGSDISLDDFIIYERRLFRENQGDISNITIDYDSNQIGLQTAEIRYKYLWHQKSQTIFIQINPVQLTLPTVSLNEGILTLDTAHTDISYQIKINDDIINLTTNTYDLNDLEPGTYMIEAKLISENDYFIDSAYSSAVTVYKLEKPNNLTYDTEVIRWNVVEHASGYQVIVNGVTYNTATNEFSYTSSALDYEIEVLAVGAVWHIPSEVASQTYERLSAVTEIAYENGYIVWTYASGDYEFIVTVNDVVYETTDTFIELNLIDGIYNVTIFVEDPANVKLSAETFSTTIEIGQLSAPTVSLNEGILTLDTAHTDISYQIKINDDIINLTTNTYDLNDLEPGTYMIEAKLISENDYFIDSAYSSAVTVYKLEKPNNLTYDTEVIRWNVVEHASGYQVIVNGVTYNTATNEFSYTSSALDYEIEVLAVGAVWHIPSEVASQTYERLSAVTEIAYENGYIVWTYASGDYEFIVTVNDVVYETTDTFIEIDLPVATYMIQIYVKDLTHTYLNTLTTVKEIIIDQLPAPNFTLTYTSSFTQQRITISPVTNAVGYMVFVEFYVNGVLQENSFNITLTNSLTYNLFLNSNVDQIIVRVLAISGSELTLDSDLSIKENIKL